MSFTHSKQTSLTTPTGQVSATAETFTAEKSVEIDVTVADAETDYEVDIDIDVSQVKSFLIISDKAITLETNNGTTPDDTLVLVANKPYDWDANSYDTFKLTTDVTSFFFTNASGADADVKIRLLIDPTV